MPNIEELMRKAMEEGKFDDLPGKGRPLHLDETNPHADPEWELAYKMLKDAGFSLPWIETRHEIENDIDHARQELQFAWNCYQAAQTEQKPANLSIGEWDRALEAFEKKLEAINKRIRDYNLQVPKAHFQRPILNYDQEAKKITLS